LLSWCCDERFSEFVPLNKLVVAASNLCLSEQRVHGTESLTSFLKVLKKFSTENVKEKLIYFEVSNLLSENLSFSSD